jgi:hypothetical protein
MHGPTCFFWANQTPFSLQDILATYKKDFAVVCHPKYKCWYTPEDEPEWAEKLFRYTLGLGATSALAPGNAEMFEMGCAFAPGRCCSPLPLPPPLLLLMLLLLCCTDSLGGDEPHESIDHGVCRSPRRAQDAVGARQREHHAL